MAGETLSGTKYDHSLKTLCLAMFVCMVALIIAGFSLMWRDHTNHTSLFIALLGFLPIMAIATQPRWQLGADALWQLRGKVKATAMAPYDSILSVRVIKSMRNGSKVFEIVTPEKTYKVDVLQGDAFEKDLASHIDPAKITVS